MNHLEEEQKLVSRNIFKKVIEKKIEMNVNTRDVCKALNIEEDVIFRYFAGEDIFNLPLGIKLLDYLEKREGNIEK